MILQMAETRSATNSLDRALAALAYGTLREMGFRSVTEPTLYRLVSETGLAASIGVLERGKVLLVSCPGDFVRADSAGGIGIGPAKGLR